MEENIEPIKVVGPGKYKPGRETIIFSDGNKMYEMDDKSVIELFATLLESIGEMDAKNEDFIFDITDKVSIYFNILEDYDDE